VLSLSVKCITKFFSAFSVQLISVFGPNKKNRAGGVLIFCNSITRFERILIHPF